MNKRIALVIGSTLSLLPVAGFTGMSMDMDMGMDMMKGNCMMCKDVSMRRHHYVMRNGIGSEYADKENPLVINQDNLDAGKILYQKNCLSCHGVSGQGDGPAGKNLSPRPANIANFIKMPMATDGYLFWTISEGGIPIKTPMPPFKSSLTEEEIWQIISYLRQI
jgi:Cytochrome C oxidase, cbb3-type, subunit III